MSLANSREDYLFAALKYTRTHFSHYRGIFLNADGTNILVLTSAGGAHRAGFEEFWKAVVRFPLYVTNYDDLRDSNFAWIVFAVPEDRLHITRQWATGKEPELLDSSE